MTKYCTIFICIFLVNVLHGQDSWNVELFGQVNRGDERYSGSWSYIAPDEREYALLGAKTGLAVYTIDDPDAIEEVGFVPGPHTNWREITVIGNYAYVVTDVMDVGHGMQVIDLSFLPDSVHLVTTYTATFDKGHIIQKDIFSDAPYVYVNGTTTTQGVHILDVSNPNNPVELGVYDPDYYIHDCHVYGDFLFAADFSNVSFDIVNISDKTNPVLIGKVTYSGKNSHSCFATSDGKFLFTADEADGFPARIFNIEDFDNPIEVAQYSGNLESLVHNPYIRGDFAFIAHNTEGLRVVDIADPRLPVEVGYYDTWADTSGGFKGLWSACPFFPSGKIIGGDRTQGLFVWTFNDTRAARIYGYVYDLTTGASIEGANIELVELDTFLSSNNAGNFKYGMLEGVYLINVSAVGYLPHFVDFQLVQGDSLFFDIPLSSDINGIFDLNTDFNLKIAPNPFDDFTIIDFKNIENAKTLELYDLNGILIKKIEIKGRDNVVLNRKDLEAGIYFVSIFSNDLKVLGTGKLIAR